MAVGPVTVVTIDRRDFQDLDNPLLSWMIDYDAVAAVLKVIDEEPKKYVIDFKR